MIQKRLSNPVMTGFPVGFEVTDGVNTVMITGAGQYIDLFDRDISNIQMTPRLKTSMVSSFVNRKRNNG
ncbi:hypothetical protein O9993_21685 [Vibrio lentus]|nr:hypothetical protein [Vibrio lentus]